MNLKQPDWSRSYCVLVLNQMLVVSLVTLLGATLLGESYRACEAADLELPGFTGWYFTSVGPAGLMLAGAVSVMVSVGAMGLRRRFAGIVVATMSFVGSIMFLAGGVFSSIAPLLAAIRAMLPPENRW